VPALPLADLLAAARAGGYAVGYFEAWDGYSLEAVVEAAEAERAPVVIGFGCLLVDQGWLDAGGIEALGGYGRAVADRARVPVAFLLNEAHTLAHALRGIDAGFTAVMIASSEREPAVAEREVSELVRAAHARGVSVEGELGSLPTGSAGEIEEAGARLTDPGEAAAFVAATGVDCLAVSFGNVHLLEGATAAIDLDLLEAIHRRAGVPLVAHGGTGFPAGAVRGAIERGVAKLNVGTVLKRAYLDGLGGTVDLPASAAELHRALGSHGRLDLLGRASARIVPVVRDLIRLYGGSGRAA
jgi:fructose/tagatose bisphosphate aldolase